MARIFSEDSKIVIFLTGVFDVMFLGFLWLMFSLPIITIGASTTAVYYTVVKGIRRKRGYIWKNFWGSFKMNFFQATLLWVGSIILDGSLALGIYLTVTDMDGMGARILMFLCIVVLVLILLMDMYFFPVLSRFKMSLKEIIKTCFILGIKHLPVSIICLVIFVANVAAIYACVLTFPLALLFMGPLFNWIYSLPMETVLKKYTPAYDEEDHTTDQWYAE